MSEAAAMPFGDYLVFVDESGDHSLTSIDPQYSAFVLAFAIIRKSDYVEKVCRELQQFKMKHWGHDEIVLHEHEIRKPCDSFAFLLNKTRREAFLSGLNDIMASLPATLVAVVIDKPAFASRHQVEAAIGVYDFAMEKGLHGVYQFLSSQGQSQLRTPIIVECRGRKEDKELELTFRRFCDVTPVHASPLPFDLVMVPKASNSAGLQLADLIARPIGLHHLRPHQPNRAFDILKTKFYRDAGGGLDKTGLLRVP
ncbi:MAG: DUF3800 domain-containing protein [Verrucomicrobiaceae bacterium]|nr:DUF3800 domain-containing protein [Verrucomicrobiaceae bacterium]